MALVALEVRVDSSFIVGAGRGVLITNSSTDEVCIPRGTIVTWYRGALVSPKVQFEMYLKDDARQDYCYQLPTMPGFGIAPTSRSIADVEVASSEDASAVIRSAAVGDSGLRPMTSFWGHFMNDSRCIAPPTLGDEAHHALANFNEALSTYRGNDADERQHRLVACHIDFAWSNGELDESTLRAEVAFPVRVDADTVLAAGATFEAMLSYGAPYWVSRAYVPLFWKQTCGDGSRGLARQMRQAALDQLGQDAATVLPELPPRAGLRPSTVSGESGVRLVDLDSGAELTDTQLRLVGLVLFDKDPAVLRLPIRGLRLLVAKALVAAA